MRKSKADPKKLRKLKTRGGTELQESARNLDQDKEMKFKVQESMNLDLKSKE